MDKQIHVWNRKQAESLEPMGVMISIHPPDGTPASLKTGWLETLVLSFEDAEPGEPDDPHVFTENHAKRIMEFCERHAEVEEWHVHCDAGFSRSVGVGIMLAEIFRRSLSLHAAGTTQHANNWVMTVMKRLQWADHSLDGKELWELAKRKTLRE